MRGSTLVILVIALLLVGGGSRLVWIEQVRGPDLRRQVEWQQRAVRMIPARRGEILDTRGRVLAGTVRRPSVFVDPYLVRDPRFAAYSLGPALGLDPGRLEQDLAAWTEKGERFVWLRRKMTNAELADFEKVVETRRLHAFEVQPEPVRVYPQGRLAAHVVGFVGFDLREQPDTGLKYEDLWGRAGVEGAYDSLLRGKPGRQTLTVDVGRRPVRAPAEAYRPAVDGATLVLTIDAYIQEITQKHLALAVNKYRAEWGAAVVLDPQSGEVLAMAVIPDFDPADAVPDNYEKLSPLQRERAQEIWRNRAIADAYEPGSVFKPFIASFALDEKLVRIDEVFAINGPTHDFGRRTISDTHAYGALAVHEIISKSSNIGMGMIGARAGMVRLYRWVRSFGFGDSTGVGLPGEHTGLVQDFSRWNPSYSPQSIPIGQEVAVTPLQLVTGFSVFCNGGVLLRPRIVRGVIGPDGVTLADYSRPVAIRRVLAEETVELFRQRALVETVTDGTGKLAKLDEYQVFGKTGTAQIARIGGGKGYLAGRYVGSFVAGAPSNRPRVVVLVSIYKPTREAYYGGTVAAPAVKAIIADTLAYMQVPPELLPEAEPQVGLAPRRR